MRWTTLGLLIGGVVLILILYRSPDSLQIGETAPDFSLVSDSGKKIALKDFQGSPTLVHFWASWCGPCFYEFPELEKLHRQFEKEGLVLLAINTDLGTLEKAREKASEFLAKVPVSFPILYDFQEEAVAVYKVQGLPSTYVVGRNGKLVAVEIGAHDWGDGEHQEMIQSLLKK